LDRFWAKLITEALQQIEEDKKKGIRHKRTPKNELVCRSFKINKQLDIELLRGLKRLYYDDVYFIEGQLNMNLC